MLATNKHNSHLKVLQSVPLILHSIPYYKMYTKQLDTVSKGSTVFRNPRVLGCSVLSTVRAGLMVNTIDPIGRSIQVV